MKNTPLLGENASDLGTGLYLRGTNYNAQHLDKFINSEVNVRFSSNQPKAKKNAYTLKLNQSNYNTTGVTLNLGDGQIQTGSVSKRVLSHLGRDVADDLKISTAISGIELPTEGAGKVELISPIRKSEALNPDNRPPKFLAPSD